MLTCGWLTLGIVSGLSQQNERLGIGDPGLPTPLTQALRSGFSTQSQGVSRLTVQRYNARLCGWRNEREAASFSGISAEQLEKRVILDEKVYQATTRPETDARRARSFHDAPVRVGEDAPRGFGAVSGDTGSSQRGGLT